MHSLSSHCSRFISFSLLTALVFLTTFCASTSDLEKEDIEKLLDRAAEEMPMSVQVDIDRYTSQLSDSYAMLYNEIPASFRNIRAEEERRNTNRGFRVQIISTRDLNEVESTEAEFLSWVREKEITPRHETYIRFRQPYYRLHLGDFISRSEAIEFSQVVREKYPNAWVVPDQIEPQAIERIQRQMEMEEAEDQAVSGER